MRSLRGRLGLLFAVGTVCITLVAAFFVAYGQWNEEQSQVPEAVNLAAFELAESRSPTSPDLTGVRGVDVFSLVFNADGEVTSTTGEVSDAMLLVIEEAIFANVNAFEVAVGYTFEPEDVVSDILFGVLVEDLSIEELEAELGGPIVTFPETSDPESGDPESGDPGERNFVPGDRDGEFLTAEELQELGPNNIDYIDLRGETISAERLAESITGGATISVSGVRCANESLCDTVVVGASERTPSGYAADNWLSLLAPSLIAGLLALLASRWLVGRALLPVDRMRAELETITGSDLERRVPVPQTGDELEQLGSSMNRTIGRLESAVTANERFVADAAHELRSPITGVRAALEVESTRAPSGLIGDSLTELDRASRLIDDLLVIARRQGGATTRTDVDLDDIVRTEVGVLRTRFPETTITTTIEPGRLSGDSDALRRVVANLLENGCLYGDGLLDVTLAEVAISPGDMTPRNVTQRDSEGRTGLRLAVEDNGSGIPEAERARVFERFARLDESRARSTGGSGLGLAIAAEIVEDHGGTITISERAGGGARFEVELPTL